MTMPPLHRVILIDPNARTITAVESPGTIEHLQELAGADYLETLSINDGDLILFGERPADSDQPFAIGAQHVIRGRAIIAHAGDDVMSTPAMTLELARDVISFTPAQAQRIALKISKKMAELLAEFPSITAKVAKAVAAHQTDKAGAALIDATSSETALLHGYTLGRIGKLDEDLKTADPENKHRLMGEHSAWRALLRQFPPR